MKNLLIVSLASLAVVGCGKGRSNNPFKALATAKKAPELQGTYQSECVANRKGRLSNVLSGNFDVNTYPSSERTLISFQGDSATIKEVHYIGKNCDGGEAFAFSEKGSFKVGNKDNNEKNNAGRFLDLQMKTVEAAVLSDAGAKYANAYGLCGRSDWKTEDKAKDVTEVAGDKNCYNVTPSREVANVYQVDNTTLALGYTGDKAVSSEQRPASLDTSNTFRKK